MARPDVEAFVERMRRSREQKALKLQQISDRTKIALTQLRALERGDLDVLPGGIYRRAMIRQYAEAVGIDASEALRELDNTPASTQEPTVPVLSPAQADAGDRGSVGFLTALWTTTVALSILGAIGTSVGAGWYREAVGASSIPPAEQAVEAAGDETVIELDARDIALEPQVAEILPGADAPATEGELRITSEPEGAQVTVNGIGWNTTPVTIRYLPLGELRIRVTKEGYAGQERTIDLTPESRTRSVQVRLPPEDER